MHKPDPNKSRITQMYLETFAGKEEVDGMEQLKSVGELLFTEKDVSDSPNHLDRILRELCFNNHITETYFNERYKFYALKELGYLPTEASNNRSNLLKSIKSGNITYKRFQLVICEVLGFKVNQLRYSFVDKDGKEQDIVLIEPSNEK